MKKNIYKLVTFILLSFLFTNCSEDYFDVNTPSGSSTEDQLGMNDLLGPTIYHSVLAHYYASRSFGNYAQNFTSQGGGSIGETTISNTWSEIYLYALPNLISIKEKAEIENSIHFRGIANVLIASNIGLATDSWDYVPLTEASQGSENTSPAYDNQQEIYEQITVLLDSAIADLSSEDNSPFSPTIKGRYCLWR